jgi:FlaG/FlaF family flagellin (archaellin)
MKTYSFFTDNKGVAPVISGLLLVAIVVVFASVLASFVFGTSGNLADEYIVGTNAQQIDPDTICITYLSANEPDLVMYLNVTVNGHYYDNNGAWNVTEGNTFSGDGITPVEKCKYIYITDSLNITSGNNHVIIVAQFRDSTQQVVLNTNV